MHSMIPFTSLTDPMEKPKPIVEILLTNSDRLIKNWILTPKIIVKSKRMSHTVKLSGMILHYDEIVYFELAPHLTPAAVDIH